jgi:tetratricopeptide (TPR) repeat protein
MTTPMLTTEHPTEELLAAFADDELDSTARREVTEHLASCGDCKETVVMNAAFKESEDVRHRTFGARKWVAALGGLAAAAAIAVIVLRPIGFFNPGIEDVVAASRKLSKRPTLGRLTGGFPYKEKAGTYRGPGDQADGLSGDDLVQKLELLQIAEKLEKKKSPDPHVFGLTTLLLAANESDLNAAVAALNTAYAKASREERDLVAVDLAAALLARGAWKGDAMDNQRALELSEDVLRRRQSPEAFWNRAVALESLYKDPEAVLAWERYLEVDPSSEWAKEAAKRKADLIEP